MNYVYIQKRTCKTKLWLSQLALSCVLDIISNIVVLITATWIIFLTVAYSSGHVTHQTHRDTLFFQLLTTLSVRQH